MRYNDKELTQQQVDLCREDATLTRDELSQKYNFDQGGQHPVVTHEDYNESGVRDPFDPSIDYRSGYRIWASIEVGWISRNS